MQIQIELDDIHTERLMFLQQRLNKPLSEIIANIVDRAVEELPPPTENEGQKILRILDEHSLLGCMEGDGKLSVNYKQHLWGNE